MELVERKTPLIDNVKSRRGTYYIKDNFVNFWFRFINPNITFIEEAIFSSNEIKASYNGYLGFVFEKVCREFLIEKRDTLSCQFQKIGSQWGTIPKQEKGKNQYEIDIVVLNEERREIGFFECKYRCLKLKEAKDILIELKKKSRYVDWNQESRREYFGMIAKKIEGKESLRKDDYIVFDFDDF